MTLDELIKELEEKGLYDDWKKNSDYWAERSSLLEDALNSKGDDYIKSLKRLYNNAIKETEKDILYWYDRFAGKEGIMTLADANKMLTSSELEEFKMTVWEYITKGESLDPAWRKQLERASTKWHITRLDSIKMQMQQHVEQLMALESSGVHSLLQSTYMDAYYQNAFNIQKGFGVGWDMMELDTNVVDKVLSKPWTADGTNFSKRIWGKYRPELVKKLNDGLALNLARGESSSTLAADIAHEFNVKLSQAENLVKTEKAYFMTVAQRDSFKELDVEKYEIVATLDTKTSEICQTMDGKVFEMKDFQPGATAPPFHNRCRTAIAPFFDDEFDYLGSRAATDDDGSFYSVPSDMTYPEWYEKFIVGNTSSSNKNVDEVAKSLIAKAKEVEPQITDNLKEIVENSGGKLEGLDFRLKGESSLTRKLKSEMNETGLSVDDVSSKMYDIVRYTSVSESDTLAKHYDDVIEKLEAKGYNIVRVKNTLGNENAVYRGINCVIENESGYKFELQFHTPESLEIKEVNHKLYEEQRLDDTMESRKEELSKEMADNTKRIKKPKNIDKIKSFNKLQKG